MSELDFETVEEENDEPEKLKFTDVPDGPEFQRIFNLPRRPVPDVTAQEGLDLAAYLTSRLAKSDEPWPGPLTPTQATSLYEAYQVKGFVGMLQPGAGKSLLSFLLPKVLGIPRCLYVTKSAMVRDTQKYFQKARQHWHGPGMHELQVEGYEIFSHPDNGEVLEDKTGKVLVKSLLARMAPKLVILDESHAVGKVFRRRLEAYLASDPEVVVCTMTGTYFKTSIKDGIDQMQWSLGASCPLPTEFQEREAWSQYLDVRKSAMRPSLGALVNFLTPQDKRDYNKEMYDDGRRSIVRRAIARWMLETPGVIGTSEPAIDTPLTIEATYPKHEEPEVEEFFEQFRELECLPDGTPLEDGMAVARHATTGGLCFWSKWEPAPEFEYRAAWSGWAKWCNKKLRSNRKGIDSEARMKREVRKHLKGLEDGLPLLEEWEVQVKEFRAATGLLEPPSVPQWFADEVITSVDAWLDEHQGLVWCPFIGLGRRLAKECKVPYYGAEGLDSKGRHITDHTTGGAVASLAANGTGRNLQGIWHTNLWLCTPTEQALARTHRPGQKAAIVRNFLYLGCAEHLKSFLHALDAKSVFAEDMQGCPQRLRYAQKIDIPTQRELAMRGGSRWRIPEKK